MSGYVKLFESLLDSTVWQEPAPTRLVWITLLAMADSRGRISASVPGLAVRAGVSLNECVVAIDRFLAPDEWSRTPDYDGRRIEVIDGGWRLLNYAKYRAIRGDEERREYMRELMARKRSAAKAGADECANTANVSKKLAELAQAEAEAERSRDIGGLGVPPDHDSEPLGPQKAPAQKAVGLASITSDAVAAYNHHMQLLPKIRPGIGTSTRQAQVKRSLKVCAEMCESLFGDKTITEHFWDGYFEQCSRDDFLAGRLVGKGHENWRPDFEYLTRPATMVKLFDRAATA